MPQKDPRDTLKEGVMGAGVRAPGVSAFPLLVKSQQKDLLTETEQTCKGLRLDALT